MKFLTKIFVVLILLFFAIFLFSTTSNSINMNLINPSSNVSNTDTQNSIVQENTNTQENTNSTESTTSTSTTIESNKDFFTADNILNIFLITIGIVLILLAIAIFIRIK